MRRDPNGWPRWMGWTVIQLVRAVFLLLLVATVSSSATSLSRH